MKYFCAFAALCAVLAIEPAAADMTTADRISCAPTRSARCNKDGKCKWKPATERDKAQVLTLDFNAKTVTVQRRDRRKQIGLVAEDKLAGGVRRVVVRSKAKSDPRDDMVLLIQKDGGFKGWRAQKRVRFEGTCKLS